MTQRLNDTHDPSLRSWIETANEPETDFPIQNLPFGVFKQMGAEETPGVGVAIGDRIVDLTACREAGVFKGLAFTAALSCDVPSLNPLMSLGHDFASALRSRLSEVLKVDGPKDDGLRDAISDALVPMSGAEMLLPVDIGDYTDFYASAYHAKNVGSMFRPDNPLLPNYKHIPVAYHGRASSVCISGTPVRRPEGQSKDDTADAPSFGPSRLLDYELEVGFFVGPGNSLGNPVAIGDAENHIFGLCVVNDWSARDLQKWEYQPLGPFLAKSFTTSISPWIVTLEALEPFRAPALVRPKGDPEPLGHLDSEENHALGAIDMVVEAYLATEKMRNEGAAPYRLSRGNFKDMYWTIAQMLTHHTSNGCNLRAADLLASGTVSGEAKDSRGCLLELTWRGQEPIQLPNGEERRFLQDGDEVTMRGFCQRDGFVRIGFGECKGTVTS